MRGSGTASGPSDNRVGWMGSRAELGAPPWVLGGTLGGHVGLQQQLFMCVCNAGSFDSLLEAPVPGMLTKCVGWSNTVLAAAHTCHLWRPLIGALELL